MSGGTIELSIHIDEIAELVCKLRPQQFLGLAKWLGVKILTMDIDPETKHAIPRNAEDILVDCITEIAALPRSNRRVLLRQLRKEVKHNGTTTDNSEEE